MLKEVNDLFITSFFSKERRILLKNLDNLRRKKGLNINIFAYDNIGKILNLCLNDIILNINDNIDYFSIIIIGYRKLID